MKQHILLFFCTFLAVGVFAQAPQGLNYQAVARNANGDPIPNQSVTINFKIHHGSANGNVVFEETQNSATDACGLFNLKIGEANAAAFNNINWSTGSKFLEVKINGSLVGTTEMLSVPYALYAEKANLQGTAGGDLNGSYPNPSVDAIQNVPVAATAPQQGQVMMFDNGNWKPVALPTMAPNIAVFEEETPWQATPPTPSGDNSWTKRVLSKTVLGSNFVSLNGPNLQFAQTGTYLISASAPAFKTGRHRLCLREAGTGVIKIEGTSEYSAAIPLQGGGSLGIVTRSVVIGTLQVTNTNTQYFLDHWVENNTGGSNGLGVGNAIPNTTIPEVYAQITIQKI